MRALAGCFGWLVAWAAARRGAGTFVVFVLGIVLQASSCASRQAPSPAGAEAPLSLDVPALVRRVHFAFRPDGDGWSGGHTTYEVRATKDALRVTPWLPASGGRPAAAGGDPLVLTVAQVGRGGGRLDAVAARGLVGDDGVLAITCGSLVERLESGEDGVEQSFTFAARPAGEGDLVVRLAAAGEAFTGATEGGLHFADPATGAGVRYGAATWVDARGRRSAARVAWDDGSIVLTVPAETIEASAYPAVLDPVIGPELGMDAPIFAPAPQWFGVPAVAWGGGSYLVAWPDARRVSVAPAAIFAARVSPAGVVLDPGGIELTPVFDAAALSDQIAPAVAWNGSVWMVVWNARNDQPSLIGARVSPQGEALDPGGIPVVPGYGSSRAAIASDGDGFLVAYTQFDGAGFVRLSAGGTPVDPAPTAFPLPANVQGVTPPAVAYNGTSYLVAYTYGSTTGAAFVARRVSPAGVILDPADIVVANEGVPPAMASDGSDWLLAWRSPSTGAIRGQRIQADGTVLDGPSGAVIADPGDAVPSQTVSVVRGAGEYAVLWLGPQQLYGARVSSAGAVVAVTGDVLADGVYRSQLAAAGDGSSYYAVYLEDVVRGGRLGPTLAKLDPSSVLIAAAANAQRYPASAYNGTSWLVVWEDGRDGQPRTYGTRVSPAGLVLDPAGIPIGPAFSALPSVGSNGTDWLVTWYGAPGSGCARVSAAGSVVDPGGITISLAGGYSGTAVASDGVDYLVAWDEPGTRIARVTAAGAVLDPGGVTLSTGTYWGAPKPAVAYGGADYLVSWRAATSPFPVLARRVTTGAVVLDPGAAAITIAAKGYDVALASSGDGWLVTWADSPRIFARRVDAGGALLDAAPILVAQGPGGRSWPTAAWDGTQYWLAWMAGDVQVDVYAARMTAAGSVLDAGGATGGSGGTGAGGGGASSSSTGTSGAGAGSSGAGGAGGAEEPPVILQPGCGCRVGDDGSPGGRAVAGLLALLVLRRRRAGPRR